MILLGRCSSFFSWSGVVAMVSSLPKRLLTYFGIDVTRVDGLISFELGAKLLINAISGKTETSIMISDVIVAQLQLSQIW
jgi:hypothetical protein